ncbi:hypothetical protein BJ165DRAFT_1523135 [Panaeolus papilionaceus]|nr:hypothetical protein BJ165DRAFT_1523135 [Panaeolus papilionaceus]
MPLFFSEVRPFVLTYTYLTKHRDKPSNQIPDKGAQVLTFSDRAPSSSDDVSPQAQAASGQTLRQVSRRISELAGVYDAACARRIVSASIRLRESLIHATTVPALTLETTREFKAWLGLCEFSFKSAGRSNCGGQAAQTNSPPPVISRRDYKIIREAKQSLETSAIEVTSKGPTYSQPAEKSLFDAAKAVIIRDRGFHSCDNSITRSLR